MASKNCELFSVTLLVSIHLDSDRLQARRREPFLLCSHHHVVETRTSLAKSTTTRAVEAHCITASKQDLSSWYNYCVATAYDITTTRRRVQSLSSSTRFSHKQRKTSFDETFVLPPSAMTTFEHVDTTRFNFFSDLFALCTRSVLGLRLSTRFF